MAMRSRPLAGRRGQHDKDPGILPKLAIAFVVVVLTAAIGFVMLRMSHFKAHMQQLHEQADKMRQMDEATASVHVVKEERSSVKDVTADEDTRTSTAFQNQEFQGDALQWGPKNLQATAQACADSCLADVKCNVWVWCGVEAGCSAGELGKLHACWLKHQPELDPVEPAGFAQRKDVMWTSGVVVTAQQLKAAQAEHAAREQREKDRIQALRDNVTLPLVFLDVEIKGKPIGRMEFVLFTHTSPLAAENFRALCTGERGVVPDDDVKGREGVGKPYVFKGNYFYRIIDRFIDQTGSNTDAVYGGMFNDESGALALKHDRPGLLSLANMGPNTNGGHFSIVVAPAPHLNTHYGIFGELVSGADVMYKINSVSAGKPDNTAGREEGVLITMSGQLRYGTASATLQANYPATAAKLVKKPDELWSKP